ncbi:putative ankyrin repeat protein RF_1087 [Sitodiplosis mosellana]|uniref:putative ankyrin repeat protein RF_1087 n=1 Tax=Sitodiplosis mosellana TaxID=263140 RepID=UPI0024451948|nr:putative ankyrin repeat protein RF_1087 [Sitodiplosis mosellana]
MIATAVRTFSTLKRVKPYLRNAIGDERLNSLASKVKEAENLIAKGADPNIGNNFNETALHYAAMKGHKSVTEVLSRKANDLDIKNNFNQTPLHLAAINGEVD